MSEPRLWAINAGPNEQIKVNGILYMTRKSRGPHNVEFTTRDLQHDSEHIRRIGSLPLKYNHGFDDRFGDREIGYVSSAKLTNTGAVFIECEVWNDDSRLPYELREIIREELRSGQLGMFSMYWDARTIGELDGQPVVDPSDRQFHEVSLCEKGFYPEARIVSFAASSDSGTLSKFKLLTVLLCSTITDSTQNLSWPPPSKLPLPLSNNKHPLPLPQPRHLPKPGSLMASNSLDFKNIPRNTLQSS